MIRKKRISLVLPALLLAILLPIQGAGQDVGFEPPPPEGALFLLLPIGAEGVALGRAMTAAASVESAFWNPAGLANLTKSNFLVMRGDPPAGESTALSWLIARQPLGVLGFSYDLLDGGTQNLVDNQGNVRGAFDVRSHIGIVSVATPLAEWLEVGLNMKIVRFLLPCRGQCDDTGVEANGWAGDFGFQSQPFPNLPLRLGAMLAHFGPKFQVVNADQADPLPTRIRFSAAYQMLGHFTDSPDLALWIRAEFEDRWRNSGEATGFYVGAELIAGAEDLVFLRASYSSEGMKEFDESAVGVGLRYQRFELSVARSFTSSVVQDTEPVYVSFGISF